MILDLTNKTPVELKQLLDKVKVSDAPIDVKQKNIENIEKALRITQGNSEVLKDILKSMPDYSDIGA